MIYTASHFNPVAHHGRIISISLQTPIDVDGHLDFFKPTQALLSQWKKSNHDDASWKEYNKGFFKLMEERRPVIALWLEKLVTFSDFTLLCYEKDDKYCHRKLVGSMVKKYRKDVWMGEGINRFQVGDRVTHRSVKRGEGAIVEVYQSGCFVRWDRVIDEKITTYPDRVLKLVDSDPRVIS